MADKIYKCIVIGGGFSGLVCANKLLDGLRSGDLLILERNDRVGKKINVTGNGRGNITNKEISICNYHGNNPSFCNYALEKHGNADLISYFEKLGILFCEENGRYYPAGFQASSISDVLRFSLAKKGAKIQVNSKVNAIERSDNIFCIKTDGGDYFAHKVVVCTGGKAQKQFGTDGDFYSVLKSLNHTVSPLYPSLVQIKTEKEKIRGLKGVKQQAKVTLLSGKNEIKSFKGDLLFTDYGISGDACFKLSAYLENKKDCSVNLEFLPEFGKKYLTEFLKNKISSGISNEEILNGVLNKQLGKTIIKQCGLSLAERAEISSADAIVDCIKCFRLAVLGTLGFDYAQVTHGGVNTDEIDEFTMSSKIVGGLYFAGEVIDIDGDCGGYNLQWAYSSAMVAAEAVIHEENN